ncbi:mitochondrial ribosomal protein L28 (bL28m) [Andalucia godoyi]|uniref:Large ribosomal subunit protein bL28c n=1 Tax=Andalucia godoyi TaxID=505711 RepID=A0A8K0AI40_ANDGO|nr:mitochondrial ribosomal protein L28 (bL28m) [Andalucia godoyi]|eukprot:ANDGO_01858.mRNA.1 mitochondrial ribosomal protein L28 (bL28m)
MSLSIAGEFARGVLHRAQRGLYAGRTILTGNNVSFSERKTRRLWKPNVQYKNMYSETLGQSIRMQVTAHALRCIDKAGGLDAYLLASRKSELNSVVGERLRKFVHIVQEASRNPEVEEEHVTKTMPPTA